jgi:hypothetical protein
MPRSWRQALTEDKRTQGRVALIRTITLTWLLAGLRSDEISRAALTEPIPAATSEPTRPHGDGQRRSSGRRTSGVGPVRHQTQNTRIRTGIALTETGRKPGQIGGYLKSIWRKTWSRAVSAWKTCR